VTGLRAHGLSGTRPTGTTATRNCSGNWATIAACRHRRTGWLRRTLARIRSGAGTRAHRRAGLLRARLLPGRALRTRTNGLTRRGPGRNWCRRPLRLWCRRRRRSRTLRRRGRLRWSGRSRRCRSRCRRRSRWRRSRRPWSCWRGRRSRNRRRARRRRRRWSRRHHSRRRSGVRLNGRRMCRRRSRRRNSHWSDWRRGSDRSLRCLHRGRWRPNHGNRRLRGFLWRGRRLWCALQLAANFLGDIHRNRAGVGLLFAYTKTRQKVDDGLCLDL
jgi:hypothetical protein